MDNFLNAIEKRSSRRKYLPMAIEESDVETLQAFISELNDKKNIKMRLILDNGDAFNGFRKSYGMFSGVRNYIALIGDKTDALALEKLGYFGERLVLQATMLGLGTCWVGGTFDRTSYPFELSKGESVVCAITVGNVLPERSVKEKLIYTITHRKSKTMEQMVISDEPVPEWFLTGIQSVQKAPSAVNRQPVMFTYKGGIVTASVKDIMGEGFALDLGIAKLHFEFGVGGGTWVFGNGAEFTRRVQDV